MYIKDYIKSYFCNRKFSFSQNMSKLVSFEKSNFNSKIVVNGGCYGYALFFIKQYESNSISLSQFYKYFEDELKSKETIHEVYFWMHIQNYICDIRANRVFDSKKFIDNRNLFSLNQEEKNKENEICSYNVLRNYLEYNELNWKYNGTIFQINNAQKSFDLMIEIFDKVNNKTKNISLCFMVSILFNDFSFISKKNNESAHKLSIIFEIKNSTTTIIFFDPNEGLYEFSAMNKNELIRKFNCFYLSIMKFIYSINSVSFEVLTLGFRSRELGKRKVNRPNMYKSVDERLNELNRKSMELFGKIK